MSASKIKVLWNSLSGAALFFTDAVVSLVLTPILVMELGQRDYGLWELMLGVVGYLGILDIGISPAMMRHVAHAESTDDREQLNRVFNTGLVVLTAVGVIGALIVAVLSLRGSDVLGLSPGEVPYVGTLFAIFAAQLLVGFVKSAMTAFIMGLQYHRFINAVRMATTVAQGVLIYWVLASDSQPPLIFVGLVVLAMGAAQALLFAGWVIRQPSVRFDTSLVSIQTTRELLTYGIKSTLLMASGTLVKRAALFVTAHVVSVAAIVFFVIPNRLIEYAQNLSIALGFPLTPYFTSVAGRGGIEAARAAWFPVTRALQFVALGMPLAVAWLGVPFLHRWMGQEYAEKGRPVLYLLCAALFIQAVACNANRVLMSLGKHGRTAVLATVLAPIAVLLCVYFGHLWGVAGIAAAVAIYLSAQAIGELYLACTELGIPLVEHLGRTVVRYLIPMLLCAGTFISMQHVNVPASYSAIVLQGAVAGAVYVMATFFFALYPNERQKIAAHFRARIGGNST